MFTQHLAAQSSDAPGEVERNAEGLCDHSAIVCGDRPIERRRPATVDVVMMQLDTSGIDAFIDELKECSYRVLASRCRNQDVVVARQIRSSGGFGVRASIRMLVACRVRRYGACHDDHAASTRGASPTADSSSSEPNSLSAKSG